MDFNDLKEAIALDNKLRDEIKPEPNSEDMKNSKKFQDFRSIKEKTDGI